MDEYISREAVLQTLQKANIGGYITERLLEIPSSDVQPVKHGRWIEQRHFPTDGYNYNVPYSTYMCSNCGLKIHNDEYSKYVRGIYTNCPICTARMDGDANV